jgi:sulfide:quinone oxidoreductase
LNSDKTVLILGGGVGGVVTANRLRKQLPKRHRVVLIDREAEHLFAPSLLWLMTGGREAARISRPLDRLGRKGIEVIRGEIEHIDPEERSVVVNGRSLTGDQLVIALGAELAPDAIPGLAEAGHDFYTLAGAEGVRAALASFRSGRIVVLTGTPAYKCPAAPYEAAMLIEHDCRKRKVRDDVHIDLYAAEPGPMGVAGADVSAGVRHMVERKGVVYHPEHQVTEVDPVARRLVFANGASADFDLLAFVPPHRAPRPVRDAGLLDDSGWIPVDRATLETRFPRVYAIGDVTSIPLTMGKPLPMAGVFAHGHAMVVATNVAHAITGRGETKAFDGHGGCFIETGAGKAGFGDGDFYGEPAPVIRMRPPARRWHWGKVLFEQAWLRRWF